MARAIIAGEWHGAVDEAKMLLESISDQWPARSRVEYLALCGGFLRFRWPDSLKRWDIGDNLNPPCRTIDLLYTEGDKCIRSVIDDRMRRLLRSTARFVTIGVDSSYFVDSTFDPHVELVFLMDLESGSLHATGKSYPNPRQQHGLMRITDLESHFFGDSNQLMLLSCHDLSLFSPRSYHNARGWRRETIERFRDLTGEKKPVLLLWHPHKSDTPRTWIPGLSGLKKELPGIGYAGAGIYYNEGLPPRASMDSVLKHTKNIPTIDFIVGRKEK